MKPGFKFITAQIAIIGLVLIGPFIYSTALPYFLKSLGSFICGLGIIILSASFSFLGKSTTPNPVPKDNAKLVTTGFYKWVRHPMYTALILISGGWSLYFGSMVSAVSTIGLMIFLNKKATFEEVLLLDKFGKNYQEYQMRTRKFFPHLW